MNILDQDEHLDQSVVDLAHQLVSAEVYQHLAEGEVDVAHHLDPGEVDQVDDVRCGRVHVQRRAVHRHGAEVRSFPTQQGCSTDDCYKEATWLFPGAIKRQTASTSRTKIIANCCR